MSSQKPAKNITHIKANLDKFAKELTENWLPSNPNILKEIRNKIRSRTYKTSKELLLEVRRDCSLFTYLLEIAPIKNKESSLEALFSMPLAKLESLIPGTISNVSKFDLSKIHEHQAQNLQLLIIASASVQILALHKGIDPDHAYLTTLLRIAGLSFSTWNYQHVYSRFLLSNGGYKGLDSTLNKRLTYSPIAVFIYQSLKWQLPCEIYRAAMKDNFFREEDGFDSDLDILIERGDTAKIDSLAEVCKIAENLAVATVSHGNSGAEALWEQASEQIKVILGPDGLKLIEENVNSLWANYASLFSGWYNEIFSSSGKIEKLASDYGKKYFHNNTHIQQCLPEIQQAFAEIYKNMTDVNTAAGAFHSLLTDLIPASGFMEGGIYIVDRMNMQVSPLMMMGRAARPGYKPAYLMAKSLDLDPLIKSLMSGTIVKGRVAVESREVLYISGAIGVPPDQIIVYLETSYQPFLSGEVDPTACFRAVQQCIMDSVMNY